MSNYIEQKPRNAIGRESFSLSAKPAEKIKKRDPIATQPYDKCRLPVPAWLMRTSKTPGRGERVKKKIRNAGFTQTVFFFPTNNSKNV